MILYSAMSSAYELCSKIRPLCYAPMLPTTGRYPLGWVLLLVLFDLTKTKTKKHFSKVYIILVFKTKTIIILS